jgi:ADP-heptose:LPS heptosyltransferase
METSNQPTLTKPEIRQRIREEKKAIKKLKRLISQEYDLPFMDRLQNRFEFLYIEKRIHEARLTELHRKLRNEKTVIVVTWSAIGDVLVCTPALKAVRRHYHDHKIIVYCYRPEHMEVLKHNPHIDSLRLLDAKHMWKYPSHLFAFLFNKKKIPYKELDFAWIPPGWFCRKSIKYVIPQIFDVELNPDEAKTEIFFTKEEEARAIHTLAPYKNVVLMHIFARSSANHLWPLEKWAALVEQLPQFTFIQIGHTDEPQVPGRQASAILSAW